VPATVLAAVTPAAPTTTTAPSPPPDAMTATTTTVAAAAPVLPVTGAATTRPLVLVGLALVGIGAAVAAAGRRFPW
jgi:LPXTG-motif cell wall-anchored protein